jgi:galactokinase
LALHDLYHLPLSRQELALVAQRAENEYVGVPTGIMDQTASLLCRSGHALFFDTRTFEVRQVPLDLAPAGLTLLVVNTGVKHALGNSAYADRVRDCRRAAEELGVAALRDVAPETMDTALAQIADEVVRSRARHVISEQSRVLEVVRLLESGRPAEVGPVLSAGHRSLRDDYEVSCAELDTVVDVAVERGALGARMTGGGFGGSAVVLVGLARAEAVAAAIAKAFAARGYSPPQTIEIVACDGASRVA